MSEDGFTSLHALGDFIDRDDEDMRARALEFFEDIKKRHSVRAFSDAPVAQEIIEACIAAAGRAPNGANHQPWHFCLIGEKAKKKQIREAAEAEERAFYQGRAGDEWLEALDPLGTDEHKPFLEIAPWLIAVFAQRRGGLNAGDDKKNYYINESVGIACGFLIAALHRAGLATLTHTPKPMTFLNETLGRPANEKPFLLIVVGKPAADAEIPDHALSKKPLADIMTVF